MKTYEQLTGAEGRRMFYRAERYKPDALFSNSVPTVSLGGEKAYLKNLSMTGAAFQSPEVEGWEERIGSEVPFELKVGEDMLFAGAGRIRSRRQNG